MATVPAPDPIVVRCVKEFRSGKYDNFRLFLERVVSYDLIVCYVSKAEVMVWKAGYELEGLHHHPDPDYEREARVLLDCL